MMDNEARSRSLRSNAGKGQEADQRSCTYAYQYVCSEESYFSLSTREVPYLNAEFHVFAFANG